MGEETPSDWSPPSLFQVASGPSAVEFEEALAVVRRYLEGHREAESTGKQALPSSPEESRRDSSEGPASAAPAPTQLGVEGNIDATSFTGDGSNLAGVATDAELGAHAGAAGAHHDQTVDTTCDGAGCDGSSFTNLNATNLSTGTVAEPRVDPAMTRDTEMAAALEALDCPAGHFVARVDGGAPVCRTPFWELTTSPSGGTPATIPESGTAGIAGPYPSTLTVTSFGGTLTDVNVTLAGVSHTYPLDLEVLLVAPTGQAVLLMRNVGGTAPGIADVDLTFDDEATQLMEVSINPASGSYLPSAFVTGDLPGPAPSGPYGTNLAEFDGLDPVGEWKLFINDDSPGDTGSLASWSLELTEGVLRPESAAPACPDDSGDIYVDCGNGTVTDNRTGLVWLANADCIGTAVDWLTATVFVAGLKDIPAGSVAATHDCGLSDRSSPGDWRLPSVDEWEVMISGALGDAEGEPNCIAAPPVITNDGGGGCWVSGPSSFSGVVSSDYWSSTSSTLDGEFTGFAWLVGLGNGNVASFVKTGGNYVWPVRDGR
jgi:subtilisin-like proprotein convertase family protein